LRTAALTPLAVAFALLTSVTAYPQTQSAQSYPPGPGGQAPTNSTSSVVVTNSAAQPVPTTVTNTVPTVIANSAAQPVPTSNAHDPAFQPFQKSLQVSLTLNQLDNIFYVLLQVPAGKRLVIENVSGWVDTFQTIGTIPRLALETVAGNSVGYRYLAMTDVGHGGGAAEDFVVTAPLRMYADPGTAVIVQLRRGVDANYATTGTVSGYVTVSGYFIDIP
jgi:hypothetical protein